MSASHASFCELRKAMAATHRSPSNINELRNPRAAALVALIHHKAYAESYSILQSNACDLLNLLHGVFV